MGLIAALVLLCALLASGRAGVHAAAPCELATPVRAAFYYPWYPENWGTAPAYPQSHYQPSLGYYQTAEPVVEQQVAALQYGHLEAAIASWWGRGSPTDQRVPALLDASSKVAGPPVCWSLYYEPAFSSVQTANDLTYISRQYAASPYFLHVNGKPVLFVYARGVTSCLQAADWVTLNAGRFYLDLNVVAGYRQCKMQPDSWHQYNATAAEDEQSGYSFSISPGFWKYTDATPLLARDLTRWRTDVGAMAASNEPWQLVTTFDEWQEGTAVEDSATWHDASTGQSEYLQALHDLTG